MAWFTYCLMKTQTKKITFKDVFAPFEEHKSGAELLAERAEIFKKFGRDENGEIIERE